MKKNMAKTMERLEIDEGMKGLVRQMWKHCYRTSNSCEGDNNEGYAYVIFSEGDGWFENNAYIYGLNKKENGECCEKYQQEIEQEMVEAGFNPKKFPNDPKLCGYCGAGMNGNQIYEGKLTKEPFTPEKIKTHKS